MTIKEQIENDIKQAMLAGDKVRTTTLRTIKSAALNLEVALGTRDTGLSDAQYIDLLSKEAKRRQESAEMYVAGGSSDRADAELAEKTIIESYLPKQLSDGELLAVIQDVISELGLDGMGSMGQIINEVKKRTAGTAEGSRIAAKVKEKLEA